MSYVVVLPSIHEPFTEACLDTCKMDNIMIVDNTVTNQGVPASWNHGLRWMMSSDADWCVILSAGVRFGEPGGLDFIDFMESHTDTSADEAPFIESSNGLGWHLIAFKRGTVEAIGYLDENYYPGYYEDNDYAYRSFLWRGRFGWPRVEVDAEVAMVAHGLKLGGVPGYNGNRERFVRKWGGEPSHETFTTPFGEDRPLSYWEPRS